MEIAEPVFTRNVTDYLNRSLPSDHVAIRIVIHKTVSNAKSCHQIQSWIVKHPVFCSALQQLNDEQEYLDETFAAVADFKLLLGKAWTWACQDFLRVNCQSRKAELSRRQRGNKLGSVSTAPRSFSSTSTVLSISSLALHV